MKIIRVGVKFVTGWRWTCWPRSLYPTHAQLGSVSNHKHLCWSGRSMCLEDSFSVPVKSAYFPFSFSSQFSRPIQADSMILLDFTTFGTYQYAQQSASVFVRSFYKAFLLWQKQFLKRGCHPSWWESHSCRNPTQLVTLHWQSQSAETAGHGMVLPTKCAFSHLD